jgi:hypothetical protein
LQLERLAKDERLRGPSIGMPAAGSSTAMPSPLGSSPYGTMRGLRRDDMAAGAGMQPNAGSTGGMGAPAAPLNTAPAIAPPFVTGFGVGGMQPLPGTHRYDR